MTDPDGGCKNCNGRSQIPQKHEAEFVHPTNEPAQRPRASARNTPFRRDGGCDDEPGLVLEVAGAGAVGLLIGGAEEERLTSQVRHGDGPAKSIRSGRTHEEAAAADALPRLSDVDDAAEKADVASTSPSAPPFGSRMRSQWRRAGRVIRLWRHRGTPRLASMAKGVSADRRQTLEESNSPLGRERRDERAVPRPPDHRVRRPRA